MTWALRLDVDPDAAREAVLAVSAQRGLRHASDAELAGTRKLRRDPDGVTRLSFQTMVLHRVAPGAVLVSTSSGGEDFARAVVAAAGGAGRFAEVELADGAVSGRARDLTASRAGDEEDLDELLAEVCHDWFAEGRYPTEAETDLLAIGVGVDEVIGGEGEVLWFHAPRPSRVQPLVDAVRTGATWRRVDVEGLPAVRVQASDGVRIAVLAAAELDEFLRAVGAAAPDR